MQAQQSQSRPSKRLVAAAVGAVAAGAACQRQHLDPRRQPGRQRGRDPDQRGDRRRDGGDHHGDGARAAVSTGGTAVSGPEAQARPRRPLRLPLPCIPGPDGAGACRAVGLDVAVELREAISPDIVLPGTSTLAIWNWNWDWNCGGEPAAGANSDSQLPTQYHASASQYQPINVNISIRIMSSGNDGAVSQTNIAKSNLAVSVASFSPIRSLPVVLPVPVVLSPSSPSASSAPGAGCAGEWGRPGGEPRSRRSDRRVRRRDRRAAVRARRRARLLQRDRDRRRYRGP